MSHAEVKNIAHSVNVRLKNLAVQKQISFDYILLRYALERFLFRLSVSQHANRFILKGASAFAVWMGPVFRVTRDADLYCSGNSDSEFLLQLLLLQYGFSSLRKTLSGRKNRFKYHRGCRKRADRQDFFLNVFSGDDFQSHRNHRGGITTDFPRRILAGMLQPGTESALFRTV